MTSFHFLVEIENVEEHQSNKDESMMLDAVLVVSIVALLLVVGGLVWKDRVVRIKSPN